MQVAKITLWDGRVFHTDDPRPERLAAFFANARTASNGQIPQDAHSQVDLIEMTPEEYQAIQATAESAVLFALPASGSSSTERALLREAQAKAVMPLIGNLLDMWDGVPNDLRSDLRGQAEGLCEAMGEIAKAMDDPSAALPEEKRG